MIINKELEDYEARVWYNRELDWYEREYKKGWRRFDFRWEGVDQERLNDYMKWVRMLLDFQWGFNQ